VFNEKFEADKGWNAWQMMREFPSINWKKNTLNDFTGKLDKTETSRPGSPELSAHDLL